MPNCLFSRNIYAILLSKNHIHITRSNTFAIQHHIAITSIPWVGKQWAATWCRSAKKLLPRRAAPRPSWSKSGWNNWHKEHTADAIDHPSPCRLEHLTAAKKLRPFTESVPWWLASCNKFARAKNSLFYQGSFYKIMPGWNRSAVQKKVAGLWSIEQDGLWMFEIYFVDAIKYIYLNIHFYTTYL